MAALQHDLRYALRQLLKTPKFTITAIVTLALGIGVNAAMFSVVDQVLLRPLPYQSADRIVEMGAQPESGGGFGSVSWPDIQDWRARSHSFQQIGFFSMQFSTMGTNADATLTPKLAVSSNLLDLLGVRPMLGRGFVSGDSKPGKNDVLILGHSAWQKSFHGDPKIVGQTVKINGDPYQVIGVMPPSFTFPTGMGGEEIFVPVNTDDKGMADRGNSALQPMGLLRPGVPVEQARNELNSIHRQLLHEYPKDESKDPIKVTSYRDALTANVRPALLALIWAVLAVWLIACTNVAGLMLTRTAGRRREIAIRGALGAPRARLVQQFFTESLLLSFAGGALGLGLAAAAIKLLKHYLSGNILFGEQVHINLPVLGFLLLISCVSAVLFGLLPAWHAARLPAQEGLREGSLGAGVSKGQSRLRDAFVVGEITLTLALLIAAGLMMRSLLSLRNVNLGFAAERVVTGQLFFPTHDNWWTVKNPENAPSIVQNFYQPLLEKLRHTPGIESVALTSVRPLEPGWNFSDGIVIKGRPKPDARDELHAQVRETNGDYFKTFGIRLMRGRFFDEQDTPDTPIAAVVNEAFVKKLFPNEDPVGQQIQIADKGPRQWATIVGVAENVHQRTPGETPLPELDLNLMQLKPTDDMYFLSTFLMNVAVRTGLPAATAEQAIRTSVHSLAPQVALDKVEPMQQVVDDSLGSQTLAARLLAIFGIAALLIALAGIYGLLAYSVSQRTRELGVRLALGAQRGDVLWLVMRHALWLLGMGVALGIGLAFAVGGVMRSFIYGLGGYDALTVFIVALLLAVCGMAASYFPARRAASIDPVEALRAE